MREKDPKGVARKSGKSGPGAESIQVKSQNAHKKHIRKVQVFHSVSGVSPVRNNQVNPGEN